jgi:hypothetical protein
MTQETGERSLAQTFTARSSDAFTAHISSQPAYCHEYNGEGKHWQFRTQFVFHSDAEERKYKEKTT